LSEEKPYLWFSEWITPSLASFWEVKRVIYQGKSKYQRIEILDLAELGLSLIIDGKVQSSELDEYIYHEALVHIPLLSHPRPERVLIVGGGEGATLREVLKHNCVKEVFMVDLDEDVVEISKRYLEKFHQGSFYDKRAKIIIEDGRRFLERQKDGEFDVIIVDVTDPLREGPSYLLFTQEFYHLCKGKLKEDGIINTQATSPTHTSLCFTSIYKTLKSVFSITEAYSCYMKSYSSIWGFAIASKLYPLRNLEESLLINRIKERGLKLKFYNPNLHKYYFLSTDPFLKEDGKIIKDKEPLFLPA